MVRNKSILISISLLLFVAMTLADTRFIYLEQEELIENHEVEREELKEVKEGEEGKNWFRLLLYGGTDYLVSQNTFIVQKRYRFHARDINEHGISFQNAEIPLFIMYCCLKIHTA